MSYDENKQLIVSYYKPLLIAQALGLVCGIFFAITLTESISDVLLAVCTCPVFMGWFRLGLYIFRFVHKNWGWIISGIITLLAEILLFYGIARITFAYQLSMILSLILIIMVSLYLLALDIKVVVTGERRFDSKWLTPLVIITSVILAITIGITCFVAWRNGKYSNASNTTTSNPEAVAIIPEMEVSTDSFHAEVIDSVVQQSLRASQECEAEDEKSDFSITVPSSVEKVIFLQAKDGEYPQKDYYSNTEMYNAVVVITGYEIKHDGVPSMKRQEWLLWFYPNYHVEAETFRYASEDEFSKYMNNCTLAEVEEWIAKEYNNMTITELPFKCV